MTSEIRESKRGLASHLLERLHLIYIGAFMVVEGCGGVKYRHTGGSPLP